MNLSYMDTHMSDSFYEHTHGRDWRPWILTWCVDCALRTYN